MQWNLVARTAFREHLPASVVEHPLEAALVASGSDEATVVEDFLDAIDLSMLAEGDGVRVRLSHLGDRLIDARFETGVSREGERWELAPLRLEVTPLER